MPGLWNQTVWVLALPLPAWEGDLAYLSIGFLVCNMEIIIVLISLYYYEG